MECCRRECAASGVLVSDGAPLAGLEDARWEGGPELEFWDMDRCCGDVGAPVVVRARTGPSRRSDEVDLTSYSLGGNGAHTTRRRTPANEVSGYGEVSGGIINPNSQETSSPS